jgi:hypothetical protein
LVDRLGYIAKSTIFPEQWLESEILESEKTEMLMIVLNQKGESISENQGLDKKVTRLRGKVVSLALVPK